MNVTNLATWFNFEKITLNLLQFEPILGVTRHISSSTFFFLPYLSMIHFLCFVLFESRRNREKFKKKMWKRNWFFHKIYNMLYNHERDDNIGGISRNKKRIEMWLICVAFFVSSFFFSPPLLLFLFLDSMCLKIHWQTDQIQRAQRKYN